MVLFFLCNVNTSAMHCNGVQLLQHPLLFSVVVCGPKLAGPASPEMTRIYQSLAQVPP